MRSVTVILVPADSALPVRQQQVPSHRPARICLRMLGGELVDYEETTTATFWRSENAHFEDGRTENDRASRLWWQLDPTRAGEHLYGDVVIAGPVENELLTTSAPAAAFALLPRIPDTQS